jgi:hypothetical protein
MTTPSDQSAPTDRIASRKREQGLRSMEQGLALLFHSQEDRVQRFLSALWQNWDMIMGEDLAALAFPIGHKDHILLVGAEDTMAMQELILQTPEMLERVNAFMDCEHFARVKVQLLMGRRPLTCGRPVRSAAPFGKKLPPRPPRLGGLLGRLDPASPVTDCYAAYVALFNSLE